MKKTAWIPVFAILLSLFLFARAEGIELNKQSATVKVSSSLQLYCRTVDTHETVPITWESSNPYVAAVDEKGKVSTKAAGDVIITATAQGGEQATCEIHVPGTPVTSIAFPSETVNLGLGQRLSFAAILSKGSSQKRVSYASSDTDIVTIDKDGAIRGVSLGTVKVRAIAANGMEAYAEVRVVVALTSIAFQRENLTLYLNGASEALEVAFTPEDTEQTALLWKSYKESVVTVDENGVVTPVGLGITKVAAKGENGKVIELPVRVINSATSVSPLNNVAVRRFEKVQLSAEVSPQDASDRSIAWSSENKNIACVLSDGTVYGLSEGVTRIIAAANGADGVYAACEVTVTENPDVEAVPIALTFDDGPAPNTLRVLEVLDKYNARATFFMVGKNVERRPDVAKAVMDAGHEIGNHTYNHANLLSSEVSEARAGIAKADAAFEKVLGITPNIIRAPGGDITDKRIHYLNESRYFIHWTGDTNDWKLKNAQKVYNRALKVVAPYGVILFHDLYKTTTQAVEKLMPYLIEHGCYFVTVSEMMEIRPPVAGTRVYD